MSLTPNHFTGTLPSDGTYRISLFLMRNEARRGHTAPFTLRVALSR